MGLVIDTCIFIQQEKLNNAANLNYLSSDESVYITAITVSELLVGVHNANTQQRKLKKAAFIEAIINKTSILVFDAQVARIHAEIHAEIHAYLAKKGNMIGAHDLIIAAITLFHSCTLVTYNLREFKRVPGLKLKVLP